MPPFRNLLSSKRNPTAIDGLEEKTQINGTGRPSLSHERSNTLSIKSTASDKVHEYKLSDINDSGVYLPPSPPEKTNSFWSKSPHSTISSNHRSLLSENEPFSISRESFESYRRSFDISARSPMPSADSLPTRASLQIDSRPSPRAGQRAALKGNTFKKPPTAEEPENEFEDVGLNDETNKPKKRGFLARFQDTPSTDSTPPATGDGAKPSSHFGFHISGRKRGQSGVGAELGSMDRPSSAKGKKDDAVVR